MAGKERSVSPLDVLPQAHREIVESYLQKVGGIPSVTKVYASSGQDIFITGVVESDDEDVWDGISHIEYDLAHSFQGTIMFREIDKLHIVEGREESEIPEGSILVFEREQLHARI